MRPAKIRDYGKSMDVGTDTHSAKMPAAYLPPDL